VIPDRFQIEQLLSGLVAGYEPNAESYTFKEATAHAYASLLMEDPEMVTDRHIKILQKDFTNEQIIAITTSVLEQICEMAYVEAFRLRCVRVLAETPALA